MRAKLIIVDADGHREEHEDKDRKTAAAIMASLRMYGTTWDEGVRKHSYGWDEKLNVHKYDSRGNEIEIDVSTKSELGSRPSIPMIGRLKQSCFVTAS